ncbi:MAG TPA: hypothetical protein VD866_10555 [Urbifossiella sp.]|nr:hypothetical protein [Urbifossiella sp.]
MSQSVSRLCLIAMGLFVCVSMTGCNGEMPSPKSRYQAGKDVVTAASILRMIPHPAAKIVSAVLIVGGTVLMIEARLADGTMEKCRFDLTPAEQADAAKGAGAVIDTQDGKVHPTPIQRP